MGIYELWEWESQSSRRCILYCIYIYTISSRKESNILAENLMYLNTRKAVNQAPIPCVNFMRLINISKENLFMEISNWNKTFFFLNSRDFLVSIRTFEPANQVSISWILYRSQKLYQLYWCMFNVVKRNIFVKIYL